MTRTIDPIVSAQWLSDNLETPGLIVIDIRGLQEYQAGHIPGAVAVPFTSWITTRDGLSLEIPDQDVLFKTIGDAGIGASSRVVVVNTAKNPYPLADTNRVADTLIYAGIRDVAVLDGGYDIWEREARTVSCSPVKPDHVEFKSETDKNIFVSRDYVRQQLENATILDARGADVYFGAVREAESARAGHIPGAKCLPAPWVWNNDGTYKSTDELKKMASNVAGQSNSREIIVYCGVGGYASTWWYILTQLLAYQNVKFYDGSAQDWAMDTDLPMVMYKWE